MLWPWNHRSKVKCFPRYRFPQIAIPSIQPAYVSKSTAVTVFSFLIILYFFICFVLIVFYKYDWMFICCGVTISPQVESRGYGCNQWIQMIVLCIHCCNPIVISYENISFLLRVILVFKWRARVIRRPQLTTGKWRVLTCGSNYSIPATRRRSYSTMVWYLASP